VSIKEIGFLTPLEVTLKICRGARGGLLTGFITILLLGCATTPAKNEISKAYTHYTWGLLYENEGNLARAIEEYKQALTYDPSSPSIHLRLGIDYIWKGEYNKAIEELELTLKSKPEDTYVRFLLALLYTSQKASKQAIKQYKQIIQLEPEGFKDSPFIFYNLGVIYLRTGKFDLALENFKKAIELRPQNAELHFVLGLAYLNIKNYLEALENFKLAVQLSELKFISDISSLRKLLPDKSESKYVSSARGWSNALAELSNGIYYFYLGVVYDKIGEEGKAAENFKKAIVLNPNNHSAYNYLGYMFAEQGINLDEAERLIKKAIEIEPEQGAYADSLGWVYYKKSLKLSGQEAKEMLEKALKEINRAIELMGDDPVVRDHLGDVYFQKGLLKRAKEEWKKSLRLDPKNKKVKKKLEKAK